MYSYNAVVAHAVHFYRNLLLFCDAVIGRAVFTGGTWRINVFHLEKPRSRLLYCNAMANPGAVLMKF